MTETHNAYAKINLGLRILRKREDGFHDIETVFHRVALHDEITLAPAAGIEVISDSHEAPGDERNICYKAAKLLQQHCGTQQGVRIIIKKMIPVGAGLGGGSSDAATVLLHTPKLWGFHVDADTLKQLALQLGSDVPFFLGAGTAVGFGRGEILEYFPLHLPYTILLCNPKIHIATAWAYSHVKPRERHDASLRDSLLKALDDPHALRGALENDFEESVFAAHPAVRDVRDAMIGLGATAAAMSGSGSTVYGLFKREYDAEQAATRFSALGYITSITPEQLHPG